jgi:hypothetical protein
MLEIALAGRKLAWKKLYLEHARNLAHFAGLRLRSS